ncbi:hypothetical protein RJ640_015565 [Escallonia rubra]|uniref:SHSP domain-containing protein n=1 Tax=Escallonia rubra TaxID=112253 RepID=A0AA88UIF6_9ASTE|nr:hypothetical protein RJ640_015565 [Escallonia rubra]
MPGVGIENVKLYVEQNTVVIKGEAESESDDEEPARRYASRLDLPLNTYKFDEIKADLKNGVLRCSFAFPASMMGWCLVAGYVVGVLEALAKSCGATCSRYGGCRDDLTSSSSKKACLGSTPREEEHYIGIDPAIITSSLLKTS